MYKNSYSDRLSSFKKWPFKEKYPPNTLAEGGFIYKEREHVLECLNCGCQINEYFIGNLSHIENNTLSPSCYCIRSLKQCLENPSDEHKSENLDIYKNYNMRINTYDFNWPKDVPVKPKELAEAGLYFTGRDDRVKCPWCRGSLYNWQYGDTGYGEHMRHFPSCPFVIEKLQDNSEAECTQTETHSLDNQNESTCVRAILDLGYSIQDIDRTIDALTAKGKKYDDLNTDMILDELFRIVEESNPTARLDETSPITIPTSEWQVNQTPECNVAQTKELANTPNVEYEPPIQNTPEDPRIQLENLKKENEVLKSNMTCKICLDAPVGELFLPCRHLVCCVECSMSVTACPVCREKIIGTIKTFI